MKKTRKKNNVLNFKMSRHTTMYMPNGYGDYLWAGRPSVFGRRPIFKPKIENFLFIKCYLFPILYTPAKFQASRFNNKRKIAKSVDPLKHSVPSIF